MEKKIFESYGIKLPYQVHGTNPELLVVSGIHGDEYGVIESVKKSVETYKNELGDFVYVPEISPSAVKAKTRCNCDGIDVNRCFVDDCTCNEALCVQEFLKQYSFIQCVSFHEDLEHTSFYLYDSGDMSDNCLNRLRKDVTSLGVGLLNGVDDDTDEHLGFKFVNGYASKIPNSEGKPVGPIEAWLIRRGVVDRVYGVEVPSMLSQDIKDKLIDKVLYNLVIC
jgi:hypothetical protein